MVELGDALDEHGPILSRHSPILLAVDCPAQEPAQGRLGHAIQHGLGSQAGLDLLQALEQAHLVDEEVLVARARQGEVLALGFVGLPELALLDEEPYLGNVVGVVLQLGDDLGQHHLLTVLCDDVSDVTGD
eukprot:7847340-Heterocapsa_arctica.AAC.1